MGYSRSKKTVQRVENHLKQMASSTVELRWTHHDPVRLAYWIRDAIKASKHHALDATQRPVEPYATYSNLETKYVLRTTGNLVIAEPRDRIPLAIEQAGMGKMVVTEAHDALEIVGAAVMHNADEMFFPDASENLDLNLINNWASKNGYFIVVNSEGVTMLKRDPGELAWRPESL